MLGDRPLFRYLNRDGLWPGFSWDGMELSPDGSLRLSSLPRFTATPGEEFANLPQPDGLAGIAIDADGTVYFTSPGSRQLLRVNGCSGEMEAIMCREWGLASPAGLAIAEERRVLFVADPGNAQVLLIDVDTLVLRDRWTGFLKPVSVALDRHGNVYVADSGAHRVDQFSRSGDRVDSFWQHFSASSPINDPLVSAEGDVIFVLDRTGGNVYITKPTGEVSAEVASGIAPASAIAVVNDVLYIGDGRRKRVTAFRKSISGVHVAVGDAGGYTGPVAALANDAGGGLLVAQGACLAPLRMAIGAGCRSSGILWSAALAIDQAPHFWNRLQAQISLPDGAHVQFFVYTDSTTPPPVNSADPEPFPAPWRAVGLDVTNFFIGGAPTPTIAIGVRFTSDLDSSPVLSQLLLAFDQESYLANLPAIYRERTCDDFLLRFASLFEGFFNEFESAIDNLPMLLDPQAAPAEELPWLSSFLAYSLPERWTLEQQRRAVADAFAHNARRGTVAGLVDTLREEAEVRAVIMEPIQNTGWWALASQPSSCLPDLADSWSGGAQLGFDTVLATAQPQGAVVGSTAILDQSHLLESNAYGMPLFEEVAHQFTVQIYRSHVECAGKLDQVKAIIEREAPAHTMYQICVVDPGVRIGYQCRLGVDTVVGAGHIPSRLGEGRLVLGGQSRGEIGLRSHLGVDTRL
jgi:phage tail-like protein